jgi:Reverse transcriptase (RNA-dependent DNA polymerase).
VTTNHEYIDRGFRQGDALSTLLFNIVLEEVMRNINSNHNITIFNRRRQYTACEDYV